MEQQAEIENLRQQLEARVPDDERAAFCRWADARTMNTRTNSAGAYAIHEVSAAWKAWQARAMLSTAPAQQASDVQGDPVAWLSIDSIGERYLCFSKPKDGDVAMPLVYPQQAITPMTEEQIVDYYFAQEVHGESTTLQGFTEGVRFAELEAVRKDSERYLWLRDTPWTPEMTNIIAFHRNAYWDAAIDAAKEQG